MVTTTFSGTQASNDIVQEERQFQKTDTVDAQTIVMPNLIFGTYEALAARLSTAAPGTIFRVYVAPQAEISVTLGSVSTERVSAPGRTFEARKHSLTFANPSRPAHRRPVDRRRAADADRDSGGRPRSDPRGRRHGRLADVEPLSRQRRRRLVRRRLLRLQAGRHLSKPADAAATTRLPAVVLDRRLGPMDRDETAYGIPIFAQLANALADAGFAVVRYDKRGVGQSGGRGEFATLADYAEDVVAAMKFLEKRKDIDPKRIALVGHSEGAAVALLAARRAAT